MEELADSRFFLPFLDFEVIDMFEVNDIVLYNRTDVCRVQEIRSMACLGERSDYYVLKPVYEDSQANSTVYVPVGADESRVRRAYSADELRAMLADGGHRAPWIDSPLIRKKEYTDLIGRGKPDELIGLIRTLVAQRAEKLRTGHKFSEADEKYLLSAQKRLFPLFRYILDVEWEEFQQIVAGK